MKLKTSIISFLFLITSGCGNNTNSAEFIQKTSGRYLYNSNELITVYFKENALFLEWRGATEIQPLKIDDNTFFVKEMNEKIQFLNNPINGKEYLVLIPKENKELKYNFRKLADNEKIASEYLINNQFDKALEAYLTIQKNDSLDPAIKEEDINSFGYDKLRNKKFENALQIFKINIELYPNSSNVYDSYAEALRKSGDTIQAIVYYKKSIAIDSGNRNAKKFIEKYDKIN